MKTGDRVVRRVDLDIVSIDSREGPDGYKKINNLVMTDNSSHSVKIEIKDMLVGPKAMLEIEKCKYGDRIATLYLVVGEP